MASEIDIWIAVQCLFATTIGLPKDDVQLLDCLDLTWWGKDEGAESSARGEGVDCWQLGVLLLSAADAGPSVHAALAVDARQLLQLMVQRGLRLRRRRPFQADTFDAFDLRILDHCLAPSAFRAKHEALAELWRLRLAGADARTAALLAPRAQASAEARSGRSPCAPQAARGAALAPPSRRPGELGGPPSLPRLLGSAAFAAAAAPQEAQEADAGPPPPSSTPPRPRSFSSSRYAAANETGTDATTGGRRSGRGASVGRIAVKVKRFWGRLEDVVRRSCSQAYGQGGPGHGAGACSDMYGTDWEEEAGEGGVLDGATPCIICLDKPPIFAFIPCGHRCLCARCAERLPTALRRRCPACRRDASSLIQIFD